MKRMVLCLFVTYGVFGIYMFYSNFYLELVLHLSPLTTALWFAPWAAGGAILASTSGFVMHKIPGRILLVVCGVAKLVAVLLFALLPERPNYWAWVFPAMVAETACVDVLYTVSNVFITTSLPSHRQGLAGSLIHCTLFLGISVFLGLADLGVGAATAVSAQVSSLRAGYKVAFWIGVGFASFALLVFATIDIGAAKSDLTADEKMGLQSGSDSRLVDTPMTERTNPMEG
ncbi:hypothetical protein VTK73DRAFT_5657 [Phialemonium thermophilum]|uniref:Major facilitator superfamily (MFS) profile domain-containing protein n=1 Tax=Phialemonium thermophilum TaxID=223376 RepID=A0ABR3V2C7_9PEZI